MTEKNPADQGDTPKSLTDEHRAYLRGAAISDEVIDASGAWSVTDRDQLPDALRSSRYCTAPGIVFPWRQGDVVEHQYRPDRPVEGEDGKPRKYLFRYQAEMILNRVRDDGQDTVILVEGTKQQLSVSSWTDAAVYGFAGAYNWGKADLSFAAGRTVIALFDGDVRTNRLVYNAAELLGETLDLMGAAEVRFALVPTSGTDGVDDFLARQPAAARPGIVAQLVAKAKGSLPKAPAKKQSHPLFDDSGLLVEKLSRAVTGKYPAALTREHRVALYRDGVYRIDETAFIGATAELLGDRNRPGHRAAAEEHTVGLLANAGLLLPERTEHRLINVANGMLDIESLELKPHDPAYLSYVQHPVEWLTGDATWRAECPVYEAWLAGTIGDQADDLEEAVAVMLDPTRTPTKAVFLYGPSRSGKSTFLRLMQAVAGPDNVSAVTLHQLSDDRFAAANVYGKTLNVAADLSSQHVDDLSIFKMMTGEDPIQANRKYGSQFAFVNRALFAFSANELPTVGESSRAYAERIKPFRFGRSFAGREDPSIEERMLHELPGILRRWVAALVRLRKRGTYRATDAAVRLEFETRSDRVRQFVEECCRVVTTTGAGNFGAGAGNSDEARAVTAGAHLPAAEVTTKVDVAQAFNRWAELNKAAAMGRNKIIDRLTSMNGVVEVRVAGSGKRGLNIVVLPEAKWGEAGDEPERATRATLNHPTQGESVLEINKGQEGDGEVYRQGVSKLPVLPVTARGPVPPVLAELFSSVEATVPACPSCGGEKAAVPPSGLLYLCPACHPASFARES